VNRTSDAIELSTNCRIEVLSARSAQLRGRAMPFGCVDELAFINPDEASADPDTQILAALRPALALNNGLLVCISSPYARRGALFKNFVAHYGKAGSSILVVKAP